MDFAAFPLLDTASGRATLVRYYEPYLELRNVVGAGIVVDTPTWRASLDWGRASGTTRSAWSRSTAAPCASSPSWWPIGPA